MEVNEYPQLPDGIPPRSRSIRRLLPEMFRRWIASRLSGFGFASPLIPTPTDRDENTGTSEARFLSHRGHGCDPERRPSVVNRGRRDRRSPDGTPFTARPSVASRSREILRRRGGLKSTDGDGGQFGEEGGRGAGAGFEVTGIGPAGGGGVEQGVIQAGAGRQMGTGGTVGQVARGQAGQERVTAAHREGTLQRLVVDLEPAAVLGQAEGSPSSEGDHDGSSAHALQGFGCRPRLLRVGTGRRRSLRRVDLDQGRTAAGGSGQ